MSRFNFTLKYVLETKMEKVDRLRRRPDWKVGIENNNNNNHTLIKYYWIHSLSKVVIEGSEVDIVEKIKNARSKDKEVVRIVEIKKTEIKVLWEDK